MAFCKHCGNEIIAGARFCGNCGKEQVNSSAVCHKCGKVLEENEKFCPACGTPVTAAPSYEPNIKSDTKPKEDKQTKEGRKIIKGGPKSTKAKQVASASQPPLNQAAKKKKRGCVGCFFKTILIFILFSAILVTVLYYTTDWWDDYKAEQGIEQLDTEGIDGIVDIEPGDVSHMPENRNKSVKAIEEPGNEMAVKIEGNPISKESLNVSEKNTVAQFKKVRVDFGQFILGKETSVNVKEYKEQTINGECSVVAYDIDLNGKSQFDDYITISLPYNESFIQNGDAEECVAPHYYNPKTKSWEPVLYELDTQNKVVNIFTDHLSRYGVFTVKNATKRNAFITSVYIPDRYVTGEKNGMHIDVLENYYENNHSLGKEALNSGLSFWGQFSGHSGVAINTLTAGGSYSTEFIDKLNDGFKNLGYAASVVQLGYDLCYSDNKTTAISLTKNIMNQLVAEFGKPAINVAFIGVYIIDVTLTEFGNAMLAQKYKELFDVYDYYNRTYNERSLKEWRALMIEIHKDNPDDPGAAYKEIMEEIEDYAWKFMETTKIGKDNENTVELNSLAGEAGLKRMTWPSGENDIDKLYGEGKQRIIDKLFPVFNSVNNWRLQNLKKELSKEASLLAKELNKKINLTITENLSEGEKAKYGGYKIAIRPLAKDVDKKNWTGTLKATGITNTSFTFMGHYTSGMPNRVEIYKPSDSPDSDKPHLVKEFIVKEGHVVIDIGDDEPGEDPYRRFDEKIFNYDYSKLYYEISKDNELEVNYRNSETKELEGMSIRFWDKERQNPQSIYYYMTGEYKNLYKQGKLGKGIEMMMEEPGIGAFTVYSLTGEKEKIGLISTHEEGYSEVITFLSKWRKTVNISINGKIREVRFFDISDSGSYCFRKEFYNKDGVKIQQNGYREDGSLVQQTFFNSDGSTKSSEYFMKEE